MIKYLIKRIISIVPIIFGLSVIVFFAMQLAPGDSARLILGVEASEETIAAANEKWGLNEPIPVQYTKWLGNAVHLDFGESLSYKEPVFGLVMDKLGPTLILALAALLIAMPIGILLGILCATFKGKWVDKILIWFNIFSISIPIFFLAIVLIIVFAGKLGMFPSAGMYSVGKTGFDNLLKHLVLPAVTLSIVPMAVIMRITRSSMIEVMSQDYMRTARAKGCNSLQRIFGHALKNAFVPILAVLGAEIGYAIGGALVVETIFSWPGIGSLLLDSILNRDFPVVVCGVLVLCSFYVVVNLIVDLLYGVFDPRIQYE